MIREGKKWGGVFEAVIILVIIGIVFWVKLIFLDKKLFNKGVNDIFFYGMLLCFVGVIFIRKKRDNSISKELNYSLDYFDNGEFINTRESYNSINDEFFKKEKYKELSKIWKIYNSSIVEIEDKGLNMFCQTTDAENFYNNDVLLKEKINMKLLNYVPQLLVGLGLLGTFLGLSIGLSDLNLKNSSDIGQVNRLIDGVKTSFYTSLYGMYFSITFTLMINCHLGEIEKKILKLKDKLNSIFHKNNGSEIIQEIKREIEKIRVSNEGMASNITNGIGNEMNKYREAIEITMKEITELLGAKIGGISQGLSGTFEKTMGESLEKIFSSDFIEKFENIKNQLIEVSEKNNIFISEYKNEIKEIAYTTGNLKESYVELTTMLVNDFNEVKNGLEEKFKNFKVIFDNSIEMYGNLNEFYNKNSLILNESTELVAKFENISKNLNEFMTTQNTTVKLWESYKESFDSINNSISSNMKEYDELIRYELNEYQKVISESSQLYENILSKNSENYGEIIDKRTLEYTKNINQGITYLFSQYEENLVSVIDKFNGVLKAFNENLKKMEETINNSHKISDINIKISKENEKAINQLLHLKQESYLHEKNSITQKNKGEN